MCVPLNRPTPRAPTPHLDSPAPRNVGSPIGAVASSHVCTAMNNILVIEFHARDVESWGALVDGAPPIADAFIAMSDAPGHGLTRNEDVAHANLEQHSSFLGEFLRNTDRHAPRNSTQIRTLLSALEPHASTKLPKHGRPQR